MLRRLVALRCVSKHEGACSGPSSSFETRARAFAFAQHLRHARSSGRGRVSPTAQLTMSNSPSRSRGAFCARVLHLCFAHPHRGVGGAPRDVRVRAKHPFRRAHDAARQALARRLASHDAGRSPLGAPPWRFWASGAALPSPALPPDQLQRAPRSQVVVPGGRLPCLPGQAVTSRRRRTPRLAPPSGSPPDDAPQ
jgi:hypothetical protein